MTEQERSNAEEMFDKLTRKQEDLVTTYNSWLDEREENIRNLTRLSQRRAAIEGSLTELQAEIHSVSEFITRLRPFLQQEEKEVSDE